MKQRRFFSDRMLDVLRDHRRWRVVSSQIPPEVAPVADRRHRRWMEAHSHSHQHTEILFVLDGQGRMGYEGRVYPFEPGTVFYFGPSETHDLEVPEWSAESEMLWVVLLGRKFLARITSFRRDVPGGRGSLGHLVMAEDSGLMAANPIGDLAARGARRSDARALQLHAGVQLLIGALLDGGDEPEVPPDEPIQRRVVRMILEHMEQTGGRKLSPAELARMSGYSKSHFMRLFHQVTGETVQQGLDRCRWQRVLELEERGWRGYEIAADLGFSCAASFSRWQRLQRRAREV